jgi:hypothetical protein
VDRAGATYLAHAAYKRGASGAPELATGGLSGVGTRHADQMPPSRRDHDSAAAGAADETLTQIW